MGNRPNRNGRIVMLEWALKIFPIESLITQINEICAWSGEIESFTSSWESKTDLDLWTQYAIRRRSKTKDSKLCANRAEERRLVYFLINCFPHEVRRKWNHQNSQFQDEKDKTFNLIFWGMLVIFSVCPAGWMSLKMAIVGHYMRCNTRALQGEAPSCCA